MSSRTITIEPVTRIEGHAKVVVHLDEAGRVERARLHVNEFRGFEKFCEGRMFYEMPQITERICGICPVSHHLASVKACDEILGVRPPRTAQLLRELMHMGQIIQSHAMHFFELAGPDLLLGFGADRAVRNVAGVAQQSPAVAAKAIALRKFGQQIIALLGERRVHPTFAIPGGVNRGLTAAERDAVLRETPGMIGYAREGMEIMKAWMERNLAEMAGFARFPTGYLSMVDAADALALYDGMLRLIDARGGLLERFEGKRYLEIIGEHVEDWSYLKFPFYRRQGWPAGAYRVGPLARLNAAARIGTPLAQGELEWLRQTQGGEMMEGTLYYHIARLIELLYALERTEQLLADPEILGRELRTVAAPKHAEGVGVIEAPRGTLFHHYWVDERGQVVRVNLIVATGHNHYAMSRAVEEVAKASIPACVEGDAPEEALNRIEAAIRAYDPCLSCSTHAAGRMPLAVELRSRGGEVVRVMTR